MKTLTIKDLSSTEELGHEAMEDVRGGRINLRQFGPTPKQPVDDGLAGGYFLPEMEIDTGGPVFLPS
jgi:hypothetical protein